jgi:hypothetical protein
MGAVQTHAQIRAAFHANLTAARLAGNGPGFAAVVTVSGHGIFDLCMAIGEGGNFRDEPFRVFR